MTFIFIDEETGQFKASYKSINQHINLIKPAFEQGTDQRKDKVIKRYYCTLPPEVARKLAADLKAAGATIDRPSPPPKKVDPALTGYREYWRKPGQYDDVDNDEGKYCPNCGADLGGQHHPSCEIFED